MTIFWIAQAIGVVALGFSVYSYQAKTREKILTRQMHGSFVYVLHFFILSAWTGLIMNLIVAARNWVFVKKDTEAWARHPLWLYLFMCIPVGVLPLVWEGWISILPTVAMLFGVYARWKGDASVIRLGTVIGLLLWIPYTVYVESYAGTASNIIILIAVLYSILKNDRKHSPAHGIGSV
jgi:hypothetical protein